MVLCADLIAIPDFPTGAMENWGLITFRLTSILFDVNKSSRRNKQWVAVVVAHELAHQVYYAPIINKILLLSYQHFVFIKVHLKDFTTDMLKFKNLYA